MGKAAKNERRKLLAAFWNNLAVAAIITGIFVPILVLAADKELGTLTLPQVFEREGFWFGAKAALLAIVTAWCLRIFAMLTAMKIED